MNLPVCEAWPSLEAALERGTRVLLVAPPGAGKSTWVPLQLLGQPWAAGRRILLLEPRRVAARAVASRMAASLAEPVGDTVGWRMRLDTRVGPRTRLEVITEGVLTRMLQQDPALEGVAAVVFDEFHERSIAADLGLALCLQAQQLLAPALRVLVMSATLDDQRLARLLGDAPVVRAEGRAHAVRIHHLGRGLPPLPEARESLTARLAPVAGQVRRVLAETEGDALVFLPGVPEIRRLQSLLTEGAGLPGVDVLALHGEMEAKAQDAALAPSGPRRRVILSTNVAETSVTVDGLRVVIDLGLARRARFDPATGMGRLASERVSRAAATQRAGRAGRTGPGDCFRLWGESGTDSLAPHTPPEILGADLAPLALELAAWGVDDVGELSWLDPPPAPALAQARDLLRQLDALDANGRITAPGRTMAGLGLHPRLGHLLLEGRRRGHGELAARLVALLTERDLLRGRADPDLRSRLELMDGRGGGEVDRGALARVRQLCDSLRERRAGREIVDDAAAGLLLSLAYPDRIAQRRAGGGPRRYLLSNGRGARLGAASSLDSADLLVAVDLDDAEGAEATLRLAAPLTAAQLADAQGAHFADDILHGFDEREGAVIHRRRRRFGALVLGEERLDADADATRAAMLEHVRSRGLSLLDWNTAAVQYRARLAFAASADPAGGWPAVDDAALLERLADWLGPLLDGVTRLAHLDRVPVAKALEHLLDFAQRRRLDTFAPTHLTMPTGSRLAVDYVDDNAPCLEVRMQEVFGLGETPRIAGGRVPVTLKLLSPARRPMQITRDLAGFWRGSYADVRKDMRGRYPRHYWPENPLEAEPTRGAPRRRS